MKRQAGYFLIIMSYVALGGCCVTQPNTITNFDSPTMIYGVNCHGQCITDADIIYSYFPNETARSAPSYHWNNQSYTRY